MHKKSRIVALLLAPALIALASCDRPADTKAPSPFQEEFVASCTASIRNPAFAWLPPGRAPEVCQCAAPRVEAQLHQAGLDGAAGKSATELAAASRIITATTIECAKPAFLAVMDAGGKARCLADAANDARLKALPQAAQEQACACAGAAYAKAADFGLALQSEKRAEFEREGAERLGRSLDACLAH